MPDTSATPAHADRVENLRRQYSAIPSGQPVRLAKPTSNLFRFRSTEDRPGLDVAPFDHVLEIDRDADRAQVEGMATYESIVDELLPSGYIPKVVPQLRTITLGGAVAGLGIESTSFRNGLPHESVREMDILTGDGRVVTARPDNEHAALLRGFPNSYGTLGYSLRLDIELERVAPYVRLRHLRFTSAAECVAELVRLCTERDCEGRRVDFLDGTVFGPDELYLTVGTYTEDAPYTSDYTGQDIYYLSLRQRHVDYLRTYDYVWRWDTDWFWCSRAFGTQNRWIRPLWPKKYRRSDVYRKLVSLDRRYALTDRISVLRGRGGNEAVIQDVEIPAERLAEFLEFFDREIGISPVWLCPVALRDAQGWPLYPMDPDTLYVNVGFWSMVPLRPGEAPGTYNRRIETAVRELGGHKSLYSNAYYTEDEFWQLYNAESYRALKQEYDADGRLPDLYDKCVRER
ncbi:FAD-binding protein [Bounagaea algeriensis]